MALTATPERIAQFEVTSLTPSLVHTITGSRAILRDTIFVVQMMDPPVPMHP